MFVRALALAWAGLVIVPPVDDDPAIADWLARLSAADPGDVRGEVVAAPDERVVAAVSMLLAKAHAATQDGDGPTPPLDGSGQVLLRIVARGHGTGVADRKLAEPHAQFLIGLENHLVARSTAHRAYELAVLDYRSKGAETLARLATVASATVQWAALHDGNFSEIWRSLNVLAEVDPALSAELSRAVQSYLMVLTTITNLRNDHSADPASGNDLNAEGVQLLSTEALQTLDEPALAIQLARLADRAGAVNEVDDSRQPSLLILADALQLRRRWMDAAPLLEELHAADPTDRSIVESLARVYAELGRWPEGKALLRGLVGDPPGPSDVPTLNVLFLLSHLCSDPESEHWRQVIHELDPDADPMAGMPKAPESTTATPPLLAAFHDGTMQVSPELFELPEEKQPAHFMAALIAGSPDGGEIAKRLFQDDPALGEAVLPLLGLRRITAERARAEKHFEAAELHFRAGRLDDAQHEYEAAIALNPDHRNAMMYLGDTWYRRGEYHQAQAHFEESLAIEPSPQAYRFLGDAMQFGGHGSARARICYEQALRLDPGYNGARLALAQLEREPRPERPASATGSPALRDMFGMLSELVPGSDTADASPASTSSTVNPVDNSSQPGEPSPDAGSVGAAPSGGWGDLLVVAAANREGPDGFMAVVDDDVRFARWVAAAAADHIDTAIMIAVSIAFQYRMKDRNIPRWKHWVEREVTLAQALPASFDPAQSRIGLGRDRLLSNALSSLADVRVEERQLPEARILLGRSLELLDAEEAARQRAGLVGETEFDRIFSTTSVRGGRLRRLADVCQRMGDMAEAAAHREQAWLIDRGRPTTEALVEALVGSADELMATGAVDRALAQYQHAVYLAEDEDSDPLVPRTLTRALNGLGRGHQRLGLRRSALGYFDRARRLNERTGNAERLAQDNLAIAKVLRDRPALVGVAGTGDARDHLERALSYASVPDPREDELGWTGSDGTRHRVSAPDRAWPILLEFGRLLQELGDDPAAARFLTIATRLADLVRAGLVDEHQRIAIQNEQIEAFTELTKVCTRLAGTGGPEAPGFADSAWLANESMRARTFLDVLGDADLTVPTGVPEPLVEREAELLAGRRTLRQSSGEDLSFWEKYREVEGELDAVWKQMRAVTPAAEGYVEVRQARPTDPADLIGLLDGGAGRPVVLASLLLLSANVLGVIALRGDQPHPVVATCQVDTARLSRFVRQNFGSTGRVREMAIDMEDLFQHELAPVAELLAAVCDPEDVLIVCPVGVLHHVPLGAVRLGDRILLERNPMGLLPSASLLRALRSAAHQEAAVPAVVFGDPIGDLPGGRSEALGVAERFGTVARLGADASTETVRRALTATAVLHVAAHAHFDSQDPLASGVVLADGLLTARDIIRLQAPALSLVVLSACETGVSETDAAEELVGLTRALLFAGADSIVVSLWKVPDLPTMDVMGAFYDGLHRGQDKIDALRGAVLAARDRYGCDRLDRWAGFQLIGDWR